MDKRLRRWMAALGIPRLARSMVVRRGRFVILMHGVLEKREDTLIDACQAGLTVAELDQILGWIEDRFAFLSPEAFFDTDKPGVLLTFDDGMANTFVNGLSLLEKYQAPAIFFVSTQHMVNPRNWLPATREWARRQWSDIGDVPEAYARALFDGMSSDQVAECAAHPLITIGSHTVSHPFLTKCDQACKEFEVTASRKYLEQVTGRSVDLFAYPTGDYDRETLDVVRAAEYRAAFVVESRNLGSPLFEIPRIGLYQADPAYLALKLSGLYRRPIRASLLSNV